MKTSATKREPRRYDWKINHEALRHAFLELWKELGYAPGIRQLAEKTGLARKTVERHLEFPFEPLKHQVRMMVDEVAMGIARSAMDGNPTSAKLYMQMFHGYAEKVRPDGALVDAAVVTPSSINLGGLNHEELAMLENLLQKASFYGNSDAGATPDNSADTGGTDSP